ncbi:hypothetical protein BDP27DRAFT_1368748 [Rhodocollybia butyracea]|uniref:Uncharacterized protein n=1 Tax=Rhodocollybia butyracea TaxID=206335 RepID=A0A9P5U0G8_9AGAR|nr:hypothetical protein BDP27DRAFT_1368748 [Rhodocollybia butyracea]
MPSISPEKYVERYGEVAKEFPGMSKNRMLEAIEHQISTILKKEAEPRPHYPGTNRLYIDLGKKSINELGTWKVNRECGWRLLDRGGLHHDPKHPESQAAFDARSRKRKASPSPATRGAKKPRLEVVAKPTQNEQQHRMAPIGMGPDEATIKLWTQHGVEQGQSLEVVSKDSKEWRKINWSTDIQVGAGDLILLRPEGVTNTVGWEVDYDNM